MATTNLIRHRNEEQDVFSNVKLIDELITDLKMKQYDLMNKALTDYLQFYGFTSYECMEEQTVNGVDGIWVENLKNDLDYDGGYYSQIFVKRGNFTMTIYELEYLTVKQIYDNHFAD